MVLELEVLTLNLQSVVRLSHFLQFKIDQSVPFVPGKIFLDIAKLFDKNISDSNYLSAGFVFGPIIIPIYQSWGNDNYPNNLNWLGERIRVRFQPLILIFSFIESFCFSISFRKF